MKFLLGVLFSFFATNAHSQNKFFVKGKIEGISDGEVIVLFRYRDGSIDEASADTIHNGNFLLSDTASKPALYWINGYGDKFPSMALEIWAAPGITVNIVGDGYLLKTWKVESPLREQQEENRYLTLNMERWNKVQELQIRGKKNRRQARNATGNVKDSLESYADLLNDREDSIRGNITRREIELLQKCPVTDVWMYKMSALAFGVKLYPETPNREAVMQLYKKIPYEKRATIIGQKITANLFPPTVVKQGEPMADIALLDTQMVAHQLAEYRHKGGYLLLDFWFVNCGPCIMAIPETKALSDSLKGKLTIIGINVDETDYWKIKSKDKQISWINLNDSRGREGLAGLYGVKAFPHYVMISPEGIVLDAWTGYEKGGLTKKVLQYIQ